jgi:1-acyl-sn-glycerol-3-phosphate acyltransferase
MILFMKSRLDYPFHKANKWPLGEWLVYNWLIERSMGRAFSAVYAYADPDALKLRRQPPVPVIFAVTHTGWWDGYMAGLLNRTVFKHDGYLMMEEASLARFPFFTWVGVFGVDRDDPRSALASVEYSVRLLTARPGRALWIFPQGTITHPDKRPPGIYGGVGNIARRVGRCAVVPVALRYEFRLEQAPVAFARFGPPLRVNLTKIRLTSRQITVLTEAAMARTDDALHADLVAGNLGHYRRVLTGRSSVNRVWDSVLRLANRVKLVAGNW